MTKESELKPKWHLVDARGQILGRLATQISRKLTGKDKPSFTPNLDDGDEVVVINAAQIKVTGKKLTDKFYYRHSGYPGGFRAESLGKLLQRRPEEVIRRAVWGMLPTNKHRKKRIARLHVFAGEEHSFGEKLVS